MIFKKVNSFVTKLISNSTASRIIRNSSWLDECSVENVGDQKYTDSWSELEFVNVSQNGGAGVAPWNVTRYSLEDKTNMIIKDRYGKSPGCCRFCSHDRSKAGCKDISSRRDSISPRVDYKRTTAGIC